ncbi:MAG: hypothetical protein BECKG1743D_GA0114223_101725 [Candidatus Kentron sp. G]|nr:MAG: hypothetical protein BECKG1743D_GA0114223_101725 [Candidatus Kentron sp. G]VFN01288.1 MAG: hypothetical protein BECKG1743F_GA0114225_105672 [Candidatus Kentron sp. G]VFN03298.1 MAG: hypothetical protein BECKG1743E_GA0114224_105992 [Candidatus Kentron sp. G]
MNTVRKRSGRDRHVTYPTWNDCRMFALNLFHIMQKVGTSGTAATKQPDRVLIVELMVNEA